VRQIITDTFISRLKVPKGKPKEYFDSKLSGFGVRIGKKGKVTFILDYQLYSYDVNTSHRKYSRYRKGFATWEKQEPSKDLRLLNADMARQEAELYLKMVKVNRDPFKLHTTSESHISTVSDLMGAYIARHISIHCTPKSRDNLEIRVNSHINPKIGHIPLIELKAAMIEQMHSEIAQGKVADPSRHKGGVVTANRCVGDLKAAFNKAIEWELVSVNPASRVKKIKEQPRKRFLDANELKRLFEAMDELEKNSTWSFKYRDCNDAVRMSLFTGCRKTELLSTEWKNIDLNSSPATWRKPHQTTKQAEWEIVPLTEECVSLLKKRRDVNDAKESPSQYVFPLPGQPEKRLQDIKKAWNTLLEKAQIEDFRFHDLRHTFASHMAIQGKSLYVIGKMLGHKNAQTTQRYAKLNTGALEDLANSMSAVVQAAVQAPSTQEFTSKD